MSIVSDKELELVGELPISEELIRKDLSQEYLTAILLISLEPFHDEIHTLQKALPKDYAKLTPELKEILSEGINKIMDKFSLTTNWGDSLVYAVFTNKLYVPKPLQPILFHIPKAYQKLESLEDYQLAVFETTNPPDNRELLTAPAIYFPYKTSITALRDWIDDNKAKLDEVFARHKRVLPKNTKIAPKTIALGTLVAIIMKERRRTFAEIKEYIDEKVQKNERFAEIMELLGNPSEDDLRNANKSFWKVINRNFNKRNFP